MRMSYEEVLELLGIVVTERSPRRLWARCPSGNHADNRPSWSLTISGANEGQSYCQSCHWGRTTLAFLVVHVRACKLADAVAWLESVGAGEAERVPVTSVRLDVAPLARAGFRLPEEIVFEPLAQWPPAMRAYAESRGITAEQVDRWRIGYAVDGALVGRIVIVTRDAHGTPTNYTGRTIGPDPRRYYNARVEERPDPKVLFGEEHWTADRSVVYVTEGALNALAVERAFAWPIMWQWPNVAALSGSRVHPAAFAKLATFRRVVVLTDPDRAGDVAAEELHQGLARATEIVRVRLPEGTDAASLSREALRAALPTPWASTGTGHTSPR